MFDELLVHVIAVIKTFQRPWCCERLIASIRRHLPNVPIIVVDDSAESYDYDCDHYVRMPFDSGLSAGRNAGVTLAQALHADTVLMLDDDMELTADNGVHEARMLLAEHDIVCGAFIEPGGVRHYEHTFSFTGDVLTLCAATGKVDCGHNFMLARIAVFDEIAWDERFKVEAEHLDFFLAAYEADMSIVYEPRMKVLHHSDDKPTEYLPYRFRKDGYGLLLDKWGLSRINDTEGRVWETPPL